MRAPVWFLIASIVSCPSVVVGCGDDSEPPSFDAGALDSGAIDSGTGSDSAMPGTDSGPPPQCSPGTMSLSTCSTPDDLCDNADGCCLCVDFAAPSCGSQWVCASPSDNDATCPPTLMEPFGSCDTVGLTCQYCNGGRPRFVNCSRNIIGVEEGLWMEVAGADCSE